MSSFLHLLCESFLPLLWPHWFYTTWRVNCLQRLPDRRDAMESAQGRWSPREEAHAIVALFVPHLFSRSPNVVRVFLPRPG